MAEVAGWSLTYEGGKRQAINPQGERVSYRAYLDARAQQSGFASYYAYSKWSKENRPFLNMFRKHPKSVKGELELGSEGIGLLRDATHSKDFSPGGVWARALETMGIREKGALYDVGDTPEV